MSPPKKKFPVSSFGPELMETLIQGAIREIVMQFPSPKKARWFRSRLHMLRTSMRDENHIHADLVMKAKVLFPNESKWEKDGPVIVIVRPRDSEFRTIVEAAGLRPEGVRPLPEEKPEPGPNQPKFHDPLEDL